MTNITVASSDFARKFGHIRQESGAVFVTHHGRETHALVPISTYRELVAKRAASTAETEPSIEELSEWLPLSLFVVRKDGTVVLANHTSHAAAGVPEGSLVGRALLEAMPALKGTMFAAYFKRALGTGEPCSFDQPSVYRDGRWMRFDIHPSHATATILARDITDDIALNRYADAKEAIIDAIAAHGAIGYIRLNIRGRIEQVDRAICDVLALPAERLAGLMVSDLVPLAGRAAFRDVVERILSGGSAERFETQFLCNDGSLVALTGAMRELRGVYGSEGAVIVTTFH